MTESIKLQNLFPKPATFTLKQVENRTFHLDPCTPLKMMEIEETFGNFENMIAKPSAENVSKLALSLMTNEDKIFFKQQTVKTIDVITGESKEIKIGGFKLLMNLVLLSVSEIYSIYAAILESIGLDRKEIDDSIGLLLDTANSETNKELKKKEIGITA